jgi:hypothetical protein
MIKMVKLFQYTPFPPYRFQGEFELQEGEERSDVTPVAPPPAHGLPGISICFDPESKNWFYREDWSPLYGDTHPLDDVLDYKALRKLEYPPETDYLDAQAKGDNIQLLAYFANCMRIKARFPKSLSPITYRSYLVKTIGLRTDKPYSDFEFGNEPPLHSYLDVHKKFDEQKIWNDKTSADVDRIRHSIELLPAFQAYEQTEKLKEVVVAQQEVIALLKKQVEDITVALRKRYII